MQFQINGQEYFLSYVEDEHCWCVIAPTAQGLQRIPIYVDAPASGRVLAAAGAHKLSS